MQEQPISAESRSTRTPPHVINVPFSMSWWALIAWGFALVIVAGLLCGALAFAIVGVIRAFDLSRFATIALLVGGNAALLGGIAAVWYFDRRRKMRKFVAAATPETLESLVQRVLSRRELDLYATDATLFTRHVARGGLRSVVLRIATHKRLAPIEPFLLPFEPQPIDEAHTGFAETMGTSVADDPTLRGTDGEMTRRLRRNVTLNGGWIALTIFGLFFAAYLIASIRAGRPSPFLYFWGGMLAMYLLAPGAKMLTSGKQWLATPGGIVARTAKWRGGWDVRRLTSETCFMLVTRAPFQEIWFATISDGAFTTRMQFTRAEMQFVLRCWLSPLEAPPIERLRELESEG